MCHLAGDFYQSRLKKMMQEGRFEKFDVKWLMDFMMKYLPTRDK